MSPGETLNPLGPTNPRSFTTFDRRALLYYHSPPVIPEDPGVSSLQVDAGWKTLDGIPCIMGGLTALVASVSGTLRGRTQNDFPWKTLPKELARLGCCLVNYPNKTLMPGETRPTLSRSKGIHDLTLPHRINLVNALKMGTLTIRAVTNDAARTRLTMSMV
ncbi:uncharacterized protein F5147DRAFT_778412 [Suillus discolor]|uniref:Uncharacterized protein n=1 Tax=Suillus discolor TaxID=1912936 RepID=A0A9P7JPJ4_9AGAM|nr:uncharacterized protein F5147DRAFT_778412 [Suillus discolor]KAG2096050.1 hypothetical protein F5147DRAFT_778412 [Suillus discolor]